MSIKSTSTVNPVLTGLAKDFRDTLSGYVARELCPVFLTGLQSSTYYKFDKENLISVPKNIRRAASSNYQRWNMSISEDNYACKEFGLEQAVDDSERKKYANSFDADASVIQATTAGILLAQEIRVRDLVLSDTVPSVTPTRKWNEIDADILGDINSGKSAISMACGLMPNVLVIGRGVFNVLQNHPSIVERVKYTSSKSITVDMLANLFEVERIRIAGRVYNSAPEGQAADPAYIWENVAILTRVEWGNNLFSPSFGRTFVWASDNGPDGILVETYRDDTIRSDVHRVRQNIDEKLCAPTCGYRFTDVLD